MLGGFAAIALLLAPCAAAETVLLRAADGTPLSAVWHAPPRQAPAVLLVHMLTRTHREWDVAVPSLRAAGLGVLAIDLRGHGASGGSWAAGLSPLQQDVQAALAWLTARSDVQAGRVGIAGASLGATLAVLGAASNQAVRSLVLISPASDYRGVRCEAAMRKFAQRSGAALLVAATGDPYASRSARALAEITPGTREVRLVEGSAAHGTALLLSHPDLLATLVDWFQKTLL